MFRIWKNAFMGLGMSSAVVLAGCASTGANAGPAAAAGPSTQAVSCTKCQATYVKVPGSDPKGHFLGYTSRTRMECPDCKTAAQNFFATGQLRHACTHCDGTMEVCDSHS